MTICLSAGLTRLMASVSRAGVVSGWDIARHKPKPARRMTAAGSVYWFRADTPEDAAALATALHGRCRSSYYGEKGFGFGVCVKQDNI